MANWLDKYTPKAQNGLSASDRDKIVQFMQKNAGKKTDAKRTDVSDNKTLTKEDMQRIASKSNPTIVTNTREQAVAKSKKYSENVIKENKEAQEKLKKERAAASKTRKAVISGDESAEFTFPDGTTKKWKDMDSREQSYVSGKNLGSWNNDNWTDYINPLAMIGSMAEGIGTAPYEAERTNSVMPYISGIASPLLTGALGGLGAKNTGQFVENIVSPAPFSMSNARNFFKRKKIDLFSERIGSALESQLGGIGSGLGEKLLDLTSKGKEKGRSFSEIFPMSKSEKAKATAEGRAANLAAEEFVKDWVYDNATDEINSEVKRKINDIMFTKGSPYATGFQQNYSPFYSVTNPLYFTRNKIVNTRYNDLIENFQLDDLDRLRILRNRGDAMGVNYSADFSPASYTFQNMGLYNYPQLEKLSTAVHEGAHTMQQLGAYEAGKVDTGFGSMLAKYDKDYKYWVPNTDTEIGRQFAEVMPTPKKGKNNWKTSPNELHSELMAARQKLVDSYVKGGYSYYDALKAARTDTDNNLDLMIENQTLNRFFKKGVSQEKKREMLRLLPAAIPAVGAVGAMGGEEEQKRNGGWLDKYEQGGMVLKQKTKDNYGKKANPNNPDVSLPPGFKGLAYNTKGRNYSPAWGGQFQDGGNLMPAMAGANQTMPMYQMGGNLFNTNKTAWVDSIHNARKGDLNFVQRMFDQRAGSIQIPGQRGTSTHFMESGDKRAYPTVVQMPNGKLQYLNQNDKDAAWNYAKRTKQFIQFPTDEQAEWYANDGYKKGTGVLEKKQMGGSIPGAVGFTYARTAGAAPSNGPYAKKTKASAQNGQEMKYYQEGLDFKPKTISQDGSEIPIDPDGYWNPENWGNPVIIPSTDITMEGVGQPLVGISDTGDIQYMEPGEDYEFDGEYVTEYPVAKKGISVNNADAQPIKKLDQSLNFTNYNKPTKGGWLDKYN